MKKLVTFLACSVFALGMITSAFAGGPACNGGKSDLTTTVSSTVKADDCSNCPLATGKFAVVSMKVSGMTCGSCESKLTQKFEKTNGIVFVANVSSADGSAKVIYDKSLAKESDVVQAVLDAGYKGEIVPAVSVTKADATTVDANGKTCTAEQLAACAKNKGASTVSADGKTCTAAERAACAAKSKEASTVSATGDKKGACCASHGSTATTTASLTSDKSNCAGMASCPASACLTKAEMAAFCAKFCAKTAASKTTSM